MKTCSACSTEMPEDAKFCPNCGARSGCPQCGYAEIDEGQKFCVKCGASLYSHGTSVSQRQDISSVPMINFNDAIVSCFKKYVDFKGRATRAEYWWWVLFIFLVILAVIIIGRGISRELGEILLFVWPCAVILPTLAVTARRLRDAGFSAWWLLLQLIPIGGLVLMILALLPSKPNANTVGEYESSIEKQVILK